MPLSLRLLSVFLCVQTPPPQIPPTFDNFISLRLSVPLEDAQLMASSRRVIKEGNSGVLLLLGNAVLNQLSIKPQLQ